MEHLSDEVTGAKHEPRTFETAAAHASAQVPVMAPMAPAGETRQALLGQRYASVTHLVVCAAHTFRGIVQIEDLLAAPAEALVKDLMDPDPPCVAPGVDQEVAAWQAVQHAEAALAVGDAAGHFVGLIPPHRLLAVLLSEHEEDLTRLGGFLKNAGLARNSSEEVVARRFWHRVPWLLRGLGGALLAAAIVRWFATPLHGQVMLAFFVPGIVSLADAVGTQTETVVVRGLSVGVSLRRMVRRARRTGGLSGLVLAIVAFPLLSWRGQRALALGVALSMCAACSTASIAAMVLPWGFDLCNVDPAFGSGPLATVLQDLLSIVIYFPVVTAIMR